MPRLGTSGKYKISVSWHGFGPEPSLQLHTERKPESGVRKGREERGTAHHGPC